MYVRLTHLAKKFKRNPVAFRRTYCDARGVEVMKLRSEKGHLVNVISEEDARRIISELNSPSPEFISVDDLMNE